MKIDTSDGSISFIEGIIRPRQGMAAFLGTRIGVAAKETLVNEDWTQLAIRPEDGIAGTLFYKGDRLDRVFVVMHIPSDSSDDWSEELELQRKARHDVWLHAELGTPPYEYPWGSVTSMYDPKSCASEIIITYAK